MARPDGRRPDELRPVRLTRNYLRFAEGSVLIEAGDTRVLCAATLENKVPPHRKGTGQGWVTAEYGLLPRSTQVRTVREAAKGRPTGRTQEIQRLIGRSLRSVVDLAALGERTVWLDCDVLQADGGTRTAAITGAFVAMVDALQRLVEAGDLPELPVRDFLAATSVGLVDGQLLLDLCYEEDSRAAVDMNVVMTGDGRFVEVQGTAEAQPFARAELDAMLALAAGGIGRLVAIQREALGELAGKVGKAAHGPGPGYQE